MKREYTPEAYPYALVLSHEQLLDLPTGNIYQWFTSSDITDSDWKFITRTEYNQYILAFGRRDDLVAFRLAFGI